MQQERDSFVFISNSEAAIARLKQASEFLTLKPVFQTDLKLFLNDDKLRPRTLMLDLASISTESIALLPKIRQILPKTQVIGLIEKNEDRNSDWFVQHYFTPQVYSSFTLEFALFQRNFCEFFAISPTDLFPDTTVYFNAYHFLPLNLKFLPLVHENFVLSERKHKRVELLKALYIFRGDSSAYVQYIEKYFDQFKVGLRKRSKARVYQLLVEWRELLYSYQLENRQIESCPVIRPDFSIWLNDLLNYLTTSDDPWSLIFEITHLTCMEFDRSLVEVIVASFLSRNLGADEAEKIVDLRLLLTLCRQRNDSLLYKRWHLGQELSEEETKKWEAYPDNISQFKLAQDYPAEIQENLKHYQSQFLAKTEKNITNGMLVYTYLGEVITGIMARSPSEQYKKDDLLESIVVKTKSDSVLPEAWIEELRQFLKK